MQVSSSHAAGRHAGHQNMAPGESVYGEKRISVENQGPANEDGTPGVTKVEYRVWNPFRSKLAAGVLGVWTKSS